MSFPPTMKKSSTNPAKHGVTVLNRARREHDSALFRLSVERAFDAIFWINRRGGFVYVNEAACRLLGYSRDELMRLSLWDIDPDYPRARWDNRWEEYERTGEDSLERIESRQRRKDGGEIPVEIFCQFVTTAGEVLHIAQVRDVSERRRAHVALNRTLRAYRVLSSCNEVLTQAVDERQLLEEVCRIAVEEGHYRFTWVGYPQHDAIKTVLPVAKAGHEAGYLDNLITWNENDVRGQGPIGRVMRTKQKVVVRNFLKDPTLKPWHEAARERGYASGLALPLVHNGELFGAIMMYSGEEDAFDVAEVELLEELAANLAVGVHLIRNSEALKASEARFRSAFENTAVGMMLLDAAGRFQRANQAFCRLVGYSEDELRARTFLEITHPDDVEKNLPAVEQLMAGEIESFFVEKRYVHKRGHPVWVHASVTVVRDAAGRPCGFIAQSQDITGRRRAVEELERTVSLLQATLEATTDGILVVNREGRILSFNRQFVEMWRIPDDVMASRDDNRALAFVLDQLQEPGRFLRKVRALNSQSEAVSFDVIKFKDGRIYERYSQPQKIKDRTVGRVWSFRDVTERRRMEEAVRRNEERLREAVRVAHIGIFDHDHVNGTIYWSPEHRRIYGWDAEEPVTTEKFMEHVPPEDRPGITEALARSMDPAGDGICDLEFRMIDRNGVMHWLATRSRTYFEEGDGVRRWARTVGAVVDITGRKQAEEALRESEERFRLAMRYSAIGMAIVALDGRFLDVNRALCQMVGYTREELLARDFQSITHPDDLAADLAHARDLLDRKIESYQMEKRYFHKNGGVVWIQLNGSLILHADGTPHHFIAQIQDISERKEADERITRYMKHMRALSARLIAVREEERRALAQELHDEIGQNLTAAKIHLHAMEQTCRNCNVPHVENLHEALLAVTKTLEQVRSLSLDLRPLQLDDLGLPVALRSLLSRDAEAGGWTAHFDENLDPARLAPALELSCYRVAQEALTNILRHSGATEVWLSLRLEGDLLRLIIRDNGRGFDLAAARDAAGSRSLGLIGMRERVENANGRIEIRTRPGAGAEVEAVFPLTAADEREAPGAESRG